MSKAQITFSPSDLEAPLCHINEHWIELERFQPKDEGTLIGLPKPYIVPSDVSQTGFAFDEMYYWDSYFTALGLIGTSKEKLAFDMLDNMLALITRFGMVPNGSRFYLTSHSQPPFLTTLILDLYALKPNLKRLEKQMDIAKYEYRDVWLSAKHPHWRKVFKGLSRYYDTNVLHGLAEAESGWDMTSRFNRECLNYIPIDLNALLYKYEQDFATAARLLGNQAEAQDWEARAEQRKWNVNRYLWDDQKGFYFDYNFVKREKSSIWSLAAYYTLWAGLASPEQASQLVQHLSKFEFKGGLTTTTKEPTKLNSVPQQWSYPNGWAPLHLLTCQGLRNYEFHEDAERVARKWINTNLTAFNKTGKFYEKYNVVSSSRPPKDGVYPSQTGFGWTNAVFNWLCFEFLNPVELPLLATVNSERFGAATKTLKRKIAGPKLEFPSPETKPNSYA